MREKTKAPKTYSGQSLAVIIPVAEGEREWKNLFHDLAALHRDDEILLASPDKSIASEVKKAAADLSCIVRFVGSAPGRARQLNAAAALTECNFLWFLHADSRLSPGTIKSLRRAITVAPESLYYFDLGFLRDGPMLTRLNGWGTWVRSHVLRLPFGDQGFCISRTLHATLGGFREDAECGEDHLYVWQAHRHGIPVRGIDARILTSARKYRRNGWAYTTVRHLFLTAKQALPELKGLLEERLRG